MRESLNSWQKNLAQGFASSAELLAFLDLPTTLASSAAESSFKTRVPRQFAARMQRGNPHDPLLRQVLAIGEELSVVQGFVSDPLEESSANPIPGLIHKYHGRVLLTVAGACAVNCRFCFRRHFPYDANNPGAKGWSAALDYIARDSAIQEVILSGGDPLLVKDSSLEALLTQLAGISHVQIVRMHTRIPVVLPDRIDAAFLTMMANSRLHKVVVLHSNHPQELDDSVRDACMALRDVGCHLLNQSVLLAGVNDDATVLADLSRRLFERGVLPYYLHLLDKVQGASHFDVSEERAMVIFEQLQSLLPGYLVPRLVREEAGKKHKTVILTNQ